LNALAVTAAVGGGGERSTTPPTRATMGQAANGGGGLLRPTLTRVSSLFSSSHQRQQTRCKTATAPDGAPMTADGTPIYTNADFDLPVAPSPPRSDQSYLDGMNEQQRAAILAPVVGGGVHVDSP
jgi:hypothetical protein